MNRSDDLGELATALAAAQAEFPPLRKDEEAKIVSKRTGKSFSYKYIDLPAVVAGAAPILKNHGLAVTQHISFDGQDDMLTTWLLHSSGQFICDSMRLHMVEKDPQAQGSATTYARRYAYMAVLGLVADDDDDGAAATRPAASKAPEPEHASQSDVEEMLAAAKGLAGSQVAAALADVGLADVKAYNKIPHDKVVELIVAFGKRQSEQLLPLDPVAPDPT